MFLSSRSTPVVPHPVSPFPLGSGVDSGGTGGFSTPKGVLFATRSSGRLGAASLESLRSGERVGGDFPVSPPTNHRSRTVFCRLTPPRHPPTKVPVPTHPGPPLTGQVCRTRRFGWRPGPTSQPPLCEKETKPLRDVQHPDLSLFPPRLRVSRTGESLPR